MIRFSLMRRMVLALGLDGSTIETEVHVKGVGGGRKVVGEIVAYNPMVREHLTAIIRSPAEARAFAARLGSAATQANRLAADMEDEIARGNR